MKLFKYVTFRHRNLSEITLVNREYVTVTKLHYRFFFIFTILNTYILLILGAMVAQWIKRWPTDLAVQSSSSAQGKIFLTANRVPLHSLSLSSAHHPDMTEILLKRTKIASHPSIDIPCQNSVKISSDSGEVDFVIFAIFSNGGHLGYLTGPNFTIMRPWSQVMLHVKFESCRCNSFMETRGP